MLNDEAVMEMARALARRVCTESAGQLQDRLAFAFRLCTARRPGAKELDRLVTLYQAQLEFYRRDRAATAAVTGTADQGETSTELAAWTMVSTVLLNLDETITKE
jgi:hypothetical protein